MSFLQKLWSGGSNPGPLHPFYYSDFVAASSGSGMMVSPETAMRLGTVYACVRAIAETVASLPLHLYKRRDDGGKERATDHPLFDILHDQPNEWQTAFEFVEMMTGHAALRGDAYAEIVPGRRGAVSQLIPIHPGRVRVEKLPNDRLKYYVRDEDGGEEIPYSQSEIFHLRGLSLDGATGLMPTDSGRETIGTAMATEQHAAHFFKNDGTPGGIIKHPTRLGDKAYSRLKAEMTDYQGVFNAHKPKILEEGMEWQSTGLDPRVTQMIEQRKYSDEQVARLFRVQPHVIGILERSTNNNIEHQGREFLTLTIQPWLCRWQGAIRRDLIAQTHVFFAEFMTEALLRGDTLSRYQVYQIGRQIEVLSANDIRLKENMNPIPGGDEYTNPNVKAAQISDNDKSGTNAPPVKEDSTQEEEEAEQSNAWLPVMLDSAVERIANVQRQDVSRMLQKYAEDHTGFDDARGKFDNRHHKFVMDALTPLSQAMERSQMPSLNPEQAADHVVTLGLAGLAPTMNYSEWSDQREKVITQLIWETIA